MAKNIPILPGIPDDEEPELFWFCSPVRKAKELWKVPVYFKNFKNKEGLTPLELSIGTLPLLRIGCKYAGGRLSEKRPLGNLSSVTIPKSIKGQFLSAIDMAKRFDYYLFKQSRIINDFVWTFTKEGIEYFVPCMEIMRMYYTRSAILAQHVMAPNQLYRFIDGANTHKFSDSIDLTLTKLWPTSLLKDDHVAHLIWVYYSEIASKGWNSVYQYIYSQARETRDVELHLKRGIPLQLAPPLDGEHQWDIRGLRNAAGTRFLILEIMCIRGLNFPFNKVTYSSPLMYNSISSSFNNDIKSNKPSKSIHMGMIEDEESSLIGQSPLQFQVQMGSIDFANPVLVEKKVARRASIPVNTNISERGIDHVIENNAETFKVSPNLPDDYGEFRGIEFKHLEIASSTPTENLRNFLSAITILKQKPVFASLDIKIVYLPNVGAAALDQHGQRRVCAVVYGRRPEKTPFCILEVSRAEASTLLICPNKEANLEDIITFLLEGLAKNKGHWQMSLITSRSDFEYERFNHVGSKEIRSIRGLVKRIIQKLIK